MYTLDLETGRRRRTLHAKRHGHADWVAAVAHTAEGRVLSGGADGKLCLWAGGGAVACEDLVPAAHGDRGVGHPVACLACDTTAAVAVSGGYDKAVRLWDVGQSERDHSGGRRRGGGGAGRELAALKGHAAPVTAVTWGSAARPGGGGKGGGGGGGGAFTLFSGDRDGVLCFWDAAAGRPLRRPFRHASEGHVTCVATALGGGGGDDGVFFSGGQVT